jgi:two-component system, NarL family, sensor kinase
MAGTMTGEPGASMDDGETRTREVSLLGAVAEALNGTLDLREGLERTLALVAGYLGLRTGWVWVRDPETGQYYSAAARHLPPYLREPVRMTGEHCWCISAMERGELTPRNIDVIECSRLRPAVQAQATDLTSGLRWHASIPLYFGGTALGIMNVTSADRRRVTRAELRLLSTVAAQVGVALERSRLTEEHARLARVEERARLAREIHDTLAQSLTAIALHLEGGLHQLERSPQEARERLERALATCRASLEEARRSVLNLRTVPLAERPLPAALAALGRAFTSETGIRVQIRVADADCTDLPLRTEGELYRIAQEALANVRRHAKASEVIVTLQADAHGVRLVVRDDGVGFTPGAAREGRYGLLGMRERAALLGGRLRIESRPGRGTTIRATIPPTDPAPAPGAP